MMTIKFMRSVFGHPKAGKVVGFKLAERIDNVKDIILVVFKA